MQQNLKPNSLLNQSEAFETLSRKRSKESLFEMAKTLSLGKDLGLSIKEICSWYLSKLSNNNHFSFWVHLHGPGNLKAFLNNFLEERRNFFDYSTVQEREDGSIVVQTPLWFLKENPDFIFTLDLSKEELSEYIVEMAEEKAEKLGIDLSIIHRNGIETAILRTLPKERF